ncbi:SUN domain-containing protein 1 isoform X1 [Synchiropus splendidus]|uniref:SUN domain-containing protein 1 isoform X1 n=2 Tax=Synchiropus splendidus TaxID=270530 RepID=UPI00237E56DE|nr:SUN domain-containing protein 1 isoform X1 [Synchiropus splendidus]
MDFSQLHTYTPPQCAPDNTGYTYSRSSSYSTAALEFEKEHEIAPVYESPRMSRRSLRLQSSVSHYNKDPMADFAKEYGSSYNGSKETRTLRSRKKQSNTLSLSLSEVLTPRKALSFSAVSTPINDGGSNQDSNSAYDASIHTHIQDQPYLRQRTITTTTASLIEGAWGRTSASSHCSSGVNGDTSTSKSHTTVANGYICKDCSFNSEKSSSPSVEPCSKALYSSTSSLSSSPPITRIYSRDRSRTNKKGFLASFCSTCVHTSKKAFASVVSFVTLLCSSMVRLCSMEQITQGTAGALSSFSNSLKSALSSGFSHLWSFKAATLHRMLGYNANGYEGHAHSSYCGSLNVKGLVTEDAAHLKLNGSLCDDCKGKQYSQTRTTLLTQSHRSQPRLAGLWNILSYAGHSLMLPAYGALNAGKAVGSAVGSGVGSVAQRLLSLLWMLLAAPGKAAKGVLWFLAMGWYQLTYLMAFLNVFFLTRCLPKLWGLLLLLLPFLVFLALWWWGLSAAALLAYLPAINLTEWRQASPVAFMSNLVPVSDPASVPVTFTERPFEKTPATPISQAPTIPPVVVSSVDLERLDNLERQLALLWDRVGKTDEKHEQSRSDMLSLYSSLQEKLISETDRERLSLWVSSMMEQRIGLLQERIQQEDTRRAQSEGGLKLHQEGQATRLADLELLLTSLAAKTEEVQLKQQQYDLKKEQLEKETVAESADTAPLSVGVSQEDHDALLAEVQRLELELGKIRHDLQDVMGCKGKCGQLDSLHETISAQVSAQVRKELHALFFGSSESGQGELPESLVHWLSQHYMRTPDLHGLLASLEMSILRNVSQQLELNRAQTLIEAESRVKTVAQTVTGTVQSCPSTKGMNEEQVELIVQNALRIYSQDRTGQVDYALESGGGSILSTRCSETYETKTALMSLFGLPLWYFSQSPRAVIQPDVYPGNCWAFKGSQGYLVIRLSMRILPTSFCVEHIPKTLSPNRNITSAPRNFTVYGLDDEYQEEGKLLGQYVYQEDGESLQTFPVLEQNDKDFQIIELRVLSNWGHPEYTCLYRFRVHGEPRF